MPSKWYKHAYLMNLEMQPNGPMCVILHLFFLLKKVKGGKRGGGRWFSTGSVFWYFLRTKIKPNLQLKLWRISGLLMSYESSIDSPCLWKMWLISERESGGRTRMCNSVRLKITCSHLYFSMWGVRAVLSLWRSEEFGARTKIQPFFYLCNLLYYCTA